METYTEPKDLVENTDYQVQRQTCMGKLSAGMIDKPIIEIINDFNKLSYCFTLQSCYGHFVFSGRENPHNLEPLPVTGTLAKVEYRIAYIALCIESSAFGKRLIESLKKIPAMDPENIQFCCAQWFWERQVNSYALQVEPDRFKTKDKVVLDYKEALQIEKIRNAFFIRLGELLEN